MSTELCIINPYLHKQVIIVNYSSNRHKQHLSLDRQQVCYSNLEPAAHHKSIKAKNLKLGSLSSMLQTSSDDLIKLPRLDSNQRPID